MWQEPVTTGPESMSCKRLNFSWEVWGSVHGCGEGGKGYRYEEQFYLKKARLIGRTIFRFCLKTARTAWIVQMVCGLCLLPLLGIFCQDREPAACQPVGARKNVCSSVVV